ncbi:MAG TPA: hypothetical protein V6C81_15370 [Planktothrix sp.]|jgi:predicted DNA binding CopG/RHH family protein
MDIKVERLKEGEGIDVDALEEDIEVWESRQLGASEEHARLVEHDISETSDLELVSIKMSQRVLKRLKQLAKAEGVEYQGFLREILCRYARENEHKLKRS